MAGTKKGRQHFHNISTRKYERQKVRTEAHKRKRQLEHIKNNPNDLLAKARG